VRAPAFKDRVKIYVTAGNGGDGCASFRREKFVPRGGPDGGDGGRGGHVYIEAERNTDSLLDLYYRPHQKAGHGGHGSSRKRHGRNGRDLVIRVPCGTVATDAESGEIIGEVVEEGERLRLARGGKGGVGNCHFVTPAHRAPREFTPGERGEQRVVVLELKMVAEVGLVGYPNAGKSTLLRRISHAHPKVAAYPFTTINPVVGTVKYDDFFSLRVADIPGLVEGAHAGVGLGHQFLRHIERTRFLVYVIDLAGSDGRNPAEDYRHLREELGLYREDLLRRPYLVAANKMDLAEARANLEVFREETGENPLPVSAATGDGLTDLLAELRRRIGDAGGAAPG